MGGAPQSPRLPPRKFLLESGLLLQELGWRSFLLSVPQVAPSSRKPSLPSLCWETPRQPWLNGPMDTLTAGRERVLPGVTQQVTLVPTKMNCALPAPGSQESLRGTQAVPPAPGSAATAVGGGKHTPLAQAGSRFVGGREEGDRSALFQRLMTRPCSWWAPCSTETWAASWRCRGGHRGHAGWGSGRPGLGEVRAQGSRPRHSPPALPQEHDRPELQGHLGDREAPSPLPAHTPGDRVRPHVQRECSPRARLRACAPLPDPTCGACSHVPTLRQP